MVSEEETMIVVHHEILRIQGVHYFNQSTELLCYLRIQDGNDTGTAGRFRCCNMETCFSVNDSINQVVIDGDCIVLQVYIIFG